MLKKSRQFLTLKKETNCTKLQHIYEPYRHFHILPLLGHDLDLSCQNDLVPTILEFE